MVIDESVRLAPGVISLRPRQHAARGIERGVERVSGNGAGRLWTHDCGELLGHVGGCVCGIWECTGGMDVSAVYDAMR